MLLDHFTRVLLALLYVLAAMVIIEDRRRKRRTKRAIEANLRRAIGG